MRRKNKPRSSWDTFASFPHNFLYEVDDSMEAVTHRLAEIEQDARLFRSSQEVSILPMQDHYVFRVRRGRLGTLSASAEGHIWQDETGCVIVEGETRVNSWNWIVPLILISLLGIFTIMGTMPAAS